MPPLLTTSAVMMCPHGGTVSGSPGATQAKADAVLLRKSDTFSIAGCAFAPGGAAHPCVSVNWIVSATRVKHAGDFVLNTSSVGLCVAGDQAPQGTVIISSAQTKVAGL